MASPMTAPMTAEQLRDELRAIQDYAREHFHDPPAFVTNALVAVSNSIGQLSARLSGMAAAPQQWQPIETAPKDGQTIIVGRDMGSFGFVRGYAYFEGVPGAFVSGWISNGFTDPPGNLGLAHPSHWMPLPTRPEPPHG